MSAVDTSRAEPDRILELSFDIVSVQRHLTQEDMLSSTPSPAVIGAERIAAFEDHVHFVYLQGVSRQSEGQESKVLGASKPGIVRRVFFIRPNLIVVDDQMDARLASEIIWTPTAPVPLDSAKQDDADEDGPYYRLRRLLPEAEEWTVGKDGEARAGARHRIRMHADEITDWIRLLHVVDFATDDQTALPACSIERENGTVKLQIEDPVDGRRSRRTIRLWIPDGSASGRIEILGSDGREMVRNRFLPAGILPPGLDGAQRRLQWDLPYQIKGLATWDTKRPSSELQRMVKGGHIKPCRAVEIGCGTGNDAIYLASQGFDVTAIDIAPTALNIAEQKAKIARVKVEWLLADILQPPSLEKFDFVYDRGCYHEVRQHHAQAYVGAVRKLASEKSKILILAGNANKDSYWRFHGPPRVKEQDVRQDFATGFQLLQLREFRFDPAPPDREGALAWSILLTPVGSKSE